MKQKIWLVIFLVMFTPGIARSELPGHYPTDKVFRLNLGSTDLFFYLSPAKQRLLGQLIADINDEKLLLTVDVNDFDCITTEVAAVASKYPHFDGRQEESFQRDPQGQRLLDEYQDNLSSLIRTELGLEMKGVSREINFVLNQDAHKYHQDHSETQFKYLSDNPEFLDKTTIVQDLTLVDWDMSKGTLSGTIFQDEISPDRYIFPLFSKDMSGMLFCQSPKYLSREAHPSYRVPTIFPYHAVVSPIDYRSNYTPGSSKGKRVSTVLRGVVPSDQLQKLSERATALELDRPTLVCERKHMKRWQYRNGLIKYSIPRHVLDKVKESLSRAKFSVDYSTSNKGVSVLHVDEATLSLLTEPLGEITSPSKTSKSVKKGYVLKKMGSGFSRLKELSLFENEYDKVLLINLSSLPKGYEHYHLAEDAIQFGLPWLQLYSCPPNAAFYGSKKTIDRLALSPLEEIFYRNVKLDAHKDDGSVELERFETTVLAIVIENEE